MADIATTAGDLFRAGRLAEAIAAANGEVRARPSDLGARVLLAELLLFDGNLERADVILDAAADLEPQAALVVAEFRQLLRADMARRQVRRDGRVPEFLSDPTPALQAMLAARVALRAGDDAAAAAAVAGAEAARPRVPGRHGETPFDDMRDACDLHVGFLEVLTTTGRYFWIPMERIDSAEFHPPKRPRDLCWRRATLAVADGPEGDVYVPVIYGTDGPTEAAEKLGRVTEWREEGGVVRGAGARTFLIGDEAVTVAGLGTLAFRGA